MPLHELRVFVSFCQGRERSLAGRVKRQKAEPPAGTSLVTGARPQLNAAGTCWLGGAGIFGGEMPSLEPGSGSVRT